MHVYIASWTDAATWEAEWDDPSYKNEDWQDFTSPTFCAVLVCNDDDDGINDWIDTLKKQAEAEWHELELEEGDEDYKTYATVHKWINDGWHGDPPHCVWHARNAAGDTLILLVIRQVEPDLLTLY